LAGNWNEITCKPRQDQPVLRFAFYLVNQIKSKTL
jgi:hypothetical protein